MKSGRLSGKKRYILLFILGMLVFLYPTFSDLYYKYITARNPVVEVLPPTAPTPSNGEESPGLTLSETEFQQIESDPAMKPLLSKELDYLRAYNKKLSAVSGYTTDPFGEGDGSSDGFEVSEDDDGASVFAYIKIDKIHQTLPVYLGATDSHLKKGAAVIQGTSIPVGGENTNSVIAGHTGLVQKFFTDLPELGPGDEITITNRWETLYYRVTGNKIIWPDQEEYLAVVDGKDMITLLTCYHGTTKNDRLLVFAERYYPKEKQEEITNEKTEEKSDEISPSYLTEVDLKVKHWYEKPYTYVISAAVILFYMFLHTFFSRKRK